MAADPAAGGPYDPADVRRHAAADAVLPGPRAATRASHNHLAEVLPDAGHRRGRTRRAPPDVLRDARQLLVRPVLQEGRDRARDRVHPGAIAARLGSRLGDRARRRPGLQARPGRGRDQGVGGDRNAPRAHRRASERRELLVCRRPGPVRPGLRDLLGLGSRARLRRPRMCAGVPTLRSLPRVLEPRVHAVRAAPGRDADAAPEGEHRHGPGPRAARGDDAGRPLRLRDRRLPDDHELGCAGEWRCLRRLRARHEGAPDPRRSRPWDDLPRRRRCHAFERGAWLRAATDHPSRRSPGADDRARRSLADQRRRRRPDGRRVPGAARESRADP